MDTMKNEVVKSATFLFPATFMAAQPELLTEHGILMMRTFR